MSEQTMTLVVLPGIDGTDVMLRPFLAALPPSIEPLVIEFPANVNRYDALLELLRRRIASLPSLYVMASSFSGPLAVMLATEEPSRVRGLILSASFVRPPRRWLSHFRFVTLTPIVWATRVTRRIPVWMKTPTDPRRIAKAETWSRVSARTLAARVHAIIRVDVTDRLRSCAQPLLYVSYEDDEAVPRDNGEQIVRQHQSAQWVTLPGRHLAMFEQPELLAEEVDRFVRGVESARG